MTATTIYDALRESHEKQRGLCTRLVRSTDPQRRTETFRTLRAELAAHAAAEERYLYVPILMYDMGLNSARHALAEHHEMDELVEDLGKLDPKGEAWGAKAKELSHKVRHHLKEEETKFFQLAGRLLSETKKKQLARKYTQEIVRMRRHYGAEYETVAVEASTGLVKPARSAADKPATRGSASAGAQLRGKAEPRRTR
jgi:hypothetical protein